MTSKTSERLMAQLDNAELVKYYPDGYLLAWFGGQSTGIHVYSADGEEVGYWQMEALPRGGYTVEQVKASMIEHMTSGEEYPY